MTLPVQVPQIEYAEDGVSTSFPVPFRYRDPAHIRAERVAPNGTVTALVAGVDYSLGAGDTASGGTLTVTVAAAAGMTLVIWRETPLKSDGDYETTGAFQAQSHEDLLDEAAMRDQDQQLHLDRAPKVPRGESIANLPALAQRKGSLSGAASAIAYAAYDADGNPTVDTPDNFAAPAAAEADRSEAEADRSETNAAFAEEFSGRAYASQAAGEAATTEGQFFRVPVGTTPETYTRYQRTAGGSVEAAPLATTVDLASTDADKGASLSKLENGANVQQALSAAANRAALAASSITPATGAIVRDDAGQPYEVVGSGEFFTNAGSTKFAPLAKDGAYRSRQFAEDGEMADALAWVGDGAAFGDYTIEGATDEALFALTGEDATPAKNVTVRNLTGVNLDGKGFDVGRRGNTADILAEQQARTGWVIENIHAEDVGDIDGGGGCYGFVFCGHEAIIRNVSVRNVREHNSNDTDGIYFKLSDSVAEGLSAHNVPATDGGVVIKGNDPLAGTTGPLGGGNIIRNLSVTMDSTFAAGDGSGKPGLGINCGGNRIENVYVAGLTGIGIRTPGAGSQTAWTIDGFEVRGCGTLNTYSAINLGVQGDEYRLSNGLVADAAGHGIEFSGHTAAASYILRGIEIRDGAQTGVRLNPSTASVLSVTFDGCTFDGNADDAIVTTATACAKIEVRNCSFPSYTNEVIDLNHSPDSFIWRNSPFKATTNSASLSTLMSLPTATDGIGQARLVITGRRGANIYRRVTELTVLNTAGTLAIVGSRAVDTVTNTAGASSWAADVYFASNNFNIRAKDDGSGEVEWTVDLNAEFWN